MKKREPKGPDYLVIDNFAEYFGLDDVLEIRKEAETLTNEICAKDQNVQNGARCDA